MDGIKEMNTAMKQKLSEDDIDLIVEKEADDDSAWDEPVQVSRKKPASLSLSTELAARATFLAKLHKEKGTDEWLTRIIRERIELEENAYAEAKREMSRRV